MASSVISSANVAKVSPTSPAQATMVAPFTGLKSSTGFPVTKKANNNITSIASNGGKVQCMQVWPPLGKKVETLSYLPDLTPEQLSKEVDYLLRQGCRLSSSPRKQIIFHIFLAYSSSWRKDLSTVRTTDLQDTMMAATGPCGNHPMFGCNDSDPVLVLSELGEAKKAYPDSFIRIIGFDNVRQVQCISFIAYKPPKA